MAAGLRESVADAPGHLGIHAKQGWPGAVVAFGGKFAGGVEAEFAADRDLGGGVVQDIGWSAGEQSVPLRVGVGAEVEEDL